MHERFAACRAARSVYPEFTRSLLAAASGEWWAKISELSPTAAPCVYLVSLHRLKFQRRGFEI